MNNWDLIESGRFADAIEGLTKEFQERPSPFLLRNRGIAHLNLGQLEQAEQDFWAAEKLSKTAGDSNRMSAGTVKWLGGHETDAGQSWADVVHDLDVRKIQYTDAAGGVEAPCLLWFAGVRLGRLEWRDAGIKSLRRTLRSKRSTAWPAALGQLVLGRALPDEVRKSVSSVAILHERELCQAEFYIAWLAFVDQRLDEFRDSLTRAASLSAALLEDELYLARYESARIVDS